jgi:hypothetical protein
MSNEDNYRPKHKSKCDDCGRKAHGTMLTCNGTPVLFLCDRCHEPNLFWKVLRDAEYAIKRGIRKAKTAVMVARMSPAERVAREEKRAAMAARIAAVKARRS